ncbi:MAG TPA: ATP-binding protein [Paludibacter sp.]|nr:ATP-binding protein [Paludibacter sp.]
MLINFSIQNFGSIKDKQTLSFEADKSKHLENYYIIETNGLRLLKLCLLYGANASGKTTVLKALDFLRDLVLKPKIQKTETLDFEPFLFDEDTPNQNTIFEIEFLQNNIRYFYEIELNKNAIVREELYIKNSHKSNVFKRDTNFKYELTSITFGNKINLDKLEKKALEANTLWNNTVFGGFSKTNLKIDDFKNVVDWFNHYLTDFISPKTDLIAFFERKELTNLLFEKNIVESLKQADFNISGISKKEFRWAQLFSKNDPYVRARDFLEFEHHVKNKNYKIRYADESRGTQKYWGLAGFLQLLLTNSAILPIDELESSLHPDLFQHFLLSFLVNSTHSQLLATTHHREILNNKDIFRNDAIWITDKSNADSATELYSLADFDTSVIRDTSNIYNAYKIGKLGGIPNLGDYYIDLEEGENEK